MRGSSGQMRVPVIRWLEDSSVSLLKFTMESLYHKEFTVWVRRCFNNIQQFHVADIVQIYLFFQNDDQPLPIQPNSKYTGRKSQLAYCRLSL